MELKETIVDGVLVIELRHDTLDASNVSVFRDQIQHFFQSHTRVVLDLSGVQFVDSSGLGALISCLRVLNNKQGDFKLCAMTTTVRALFELMRMHRVFNIYDDQQAAVNSFS
jgi:anti-sigma B factor antagonist